MNSFTINSNSITPKTSFAPCGSWTTALPNRMISKNSDYSSTNLKLKAKNAAYIMLLAAFWGSFFLIPLMG